MVGELAILLIPDIDHELKCLRKWFKIMESCLQPLDFRAKYTKTEIETKALELNVSISTPNLFFILTFMDISPFSYIYIFLQFKVHVCIFCIGIIFLMIIDVNSK